MASLLKKLRDKRTPTLSSPTDIGYTEAADRLLAAKEGRVATEAAPTNVYAERAVQQQTQGQLASIADKARVQAAGESVTESGLLQRERQEADKSSLEMASMDSKRNQAIQDMRKRMEQEAVKLGLDKDRAASESRLFERRLTDDRYIRDLKLQAAENRLYDKTEFDKMLNSQLIGENMATDMTEREYRKMLSADQREWEKYIQTMDIERLMKLNKDRIKADADRAMWETSTSAISTGADSYMKSDTAKGKESSNG